MKILWLSWKDINHPLAGGAEVVLHELSKRLVNEGHEVTVLTAMYEGASAEDTIDGVKIIRTGNNKYTHSFAALNYFVRHLRGKYDLVIEVINTAPYFSPFFEKEGRSVLFYHQLAREIWFYETPFPLNFLGFDILEPAATFLLSKSGTTAIAVSESTRKDLKKHGFNESRISLISEGIEIEPIHDPRKVKKFEQPTLLSFGSIRAMKRTAHQIRAFEIAKQQIPELQLKVAGGASGAYGQKVLRMIEESPYADSIEYLGRVSTEQKIELMQKSHAILVTSLKEGWGLIVTEAASQGTPALVYDADGLRDSVIDKKTGLVASYNMPDGLAVVIVDFFKDKDRSATMSINAWEMSKEINFDRSFEQFKQAAKIQ